MLRKTCSLSVVFSRQDLIVRNKEEPQYFQQLIEDEIESRYRSYFNTAIRYVRLAASPDGSGVWATGRRRGSSRFLDSRASRIAHVVADYDLRTIRFKPG